MTRTLAFAGAKGGQGTTTIAAATAVLAAGHVPTTLVAPEASDAATLLGLPRTADGGPIQVTPTLWLSPEAVEGMAVTVVDGPPLSSADEQYLVVRGPCYLALAAALRHDSPPDGIVLLQEPGRSLTARDVTEVTGIPVVAQVAVSDVVARAIDAGLLLARLHHLADLHPLRTLATPSTPRPLRTTATPCRQTPTTRSTTGTDLPLPQSGSGGDGGTRVKTRREPHASMHVGRPWRRSDRRTAPDVEHREARARRRGLLHRRGRDLRRGLLHRPR